MHRRICTEESQLVETSALCPLLQAVAELKKRAEEIAQTLTMESGKPIKDARGEVTRTIDTFQVAAEESVRIYGEHMPLDISARNKGLQVNATTCCITSMHALLDSAIIKSS